AGTVPTAHSQPSDVKVGLKEKLGEMTMHVTVIPIPLRPADTQVMVSDPNSPKTVNIITGGPIIKAQADKQNEIDLSINPGGQAVIITKVDKAPTGSVIVTVTNNIGVTGI